MDDVACEGFPVRYKAHMQIEKRFIYFFVFFTLQLQCCFYCSHPLHGPNAFEIWISSGPARGISPASQRASKMASMSEFP